MYRKGGADSQTDSECSCVLGFCVRARYAGGTVVPFPEGNVTWHMCLLFGTPLKPKAPGTAEISAD